MHAHRHTPIASSSPPLPPPPPPPPVIAISSLDRKTGCFAFWEDCFNVADIVTEWREEWG